MTYSVEIVIDSDDGRKATWVVDNVESMVEAEDVANDLVDYAATALGLEVSQLDQ